MKNDNFVKTGDRAKKRRGRGRGEREGIQRSRYTTVGGYVQPLATDCGICSPGVDTASGVP